MISSVFVDRPRLAIVIAFIITIAGADHHIDQWNRIDSGYKQKLIDWLQHTLGESH